MKSVLVLGATGAMGRYLVPELVSLGYDVTGVGLEEKAPWSLNASYVKGNAFDKEFLENLLKEKFDGIVNFMCYGEHKFSEYYKLFLENMSVRSTIRFYRIANVIYLPWLAYALYVTLKNREVIIAILTRRL